MKAMTVRHAFAVAFCLCLVDAHAQISNAPPGSAIGNSETKPIAPIAIGPGGSGLTRPVAQTGAAATGGVLAGGASTPAARPTQVTTSGPLGKGPAAASANPGAVVPAAVPTRTATRRLEAPAPRQTSTDAYSALNAPAAPPTPLYSPLPSLGMAPGSGTGGKPLVVRCQSGVNEILSLASGYPNQILTPFATPRMIDAKGDDDNLTYGNSLFITLKRDKPIAIWITDKKPGAPMCSLTLVPKAIPPQNIVLELEGQTARPSASASPSTEETGRESQYTVNLRTLLRSVARNIVPRGFSDEKLNVGIAISNGIEAKPLRLYSGTDFDIYRYHLTNKNGASVTLSEEAFGTKGVRAVAFFPRIQLAPGQETDVFIVSDRADSSNSGEDGEISQ